MEQWLGNIKQMKHVDLKAQRVNILKDLWN